MMAKISGAAQDMQQLVMPKLLDELVFVLQPQVRGQQI